MALLLSLCSILPSSSSSFIDVTRCRIEARGSQGSPVTLFFYFSSKLFLFQIVKFGKKRRYRRLQVSSFLFHQKKSWVFNQLFWELLERVPRQQQCHSFTCVSLVEQSSRFASHFINIFRHRSLQIRIERQLQERVALLLELLDWITQAEEALGSEQPQSEEARVLTEQLNAHKVYTSRILKQYTQLESTL